MASNGNTEKLLFTNLRNKAIRVGQEVLLTLIGENAKKGKISLISTSRNRIQVKITMTFKSYLSSITVIYIFSWKTSLIVERIQKLPMLSDSMKMK